ncbi:MAG TPA: amino acid permease [Herpetosiphonaceae bacterium]
MSTSSSELAKTLTIGEAIGLAISIVVGSGLLVLPGLAYQLSGGAAIYSWLLNALLVIPLLIIFAYLGANFPSAGGIAGFVQAAFSRPLAAATELLVLGTFSLGIPAIATTGGNYFSLAINGGTIGTIIGTLGLLALAAIVNYQGAKISGRIQQILSFSLVAILGIAALAALIFGDHSVGTPVAPLSMWQAALPSLGLVFFAYTGWEMLSFTAEEYRNPRRDFPIAVSASFIIVILLYLAIALGIQLTLSPQDSALTTAPVARMLGAVLGSVSEKVVALIGVVIIATNLIGATWAASRLVFSSAREGLLPRVLAEVDPRSRTPRPAIALVITIFTIVAVTHFLGIVTLGQLLQIAGQNFFILYGLSVIAYIKLASNLWFRLFGLVSLALVMVTMGTFGWALLYPLALILLGLLLVRRRTARVQPVHAAE